MAGKKTRRPKSITIGSRLKARAIRGPKPGGRWYWRAESYDPASQRRATAAAITGHTPAVMLKHYRTVSSDDRREAIERAGLGQIPAGTVLPLRTRSREDN